MRSLRLFAVILSLSVSANVALSQSKAKPKPTPVRKAVTVTDYAASSSLKGSDYSNKLLGVKLTMPEGWESNLEMSQDVLNDAKDKITANKSTSFKKGMDASISNTRILFQSLSRDTSFGVGHFSAGIEANRANQTAAYYTKFNRDLILSSNKGSIVTKDIHSVKLAGATFNSFQLEKPNGTQTMKQTYYVMLRRGTMFFFVLSYLDDAGKAAMETSLATLTLDK